MAPLSNANSSLVALCLVTELDKARVVDFYGPLEQSASYSATDNTIVQRCVTSKACRQKIKGADSVM